MGDVKYEVTRVVGIIKEGSKGWKTELNLVSWNGREPKYDLRDWNEDHTSMGKGITLTKEEAMNLMNILMKELG
jgi:hypothetical protein